MRNRFSYRTLRSVIALGVLSAGTLAVAETRDSRRSDADVDAQRPRYVYFGNGQYLLPDYGNQPVHEPYSLTGRQEDPRVDDLGRPGYFMYVGQSRVWMPEAR